MTIIKCPNCGCSIVAINTLPSEIVIVKKLTDVWFINENEVVCHCGAKHDIRYLPVEVGSDDQGSWIFAL